MARRPTTAADAAVHQGTLDQGMVDLPQPQPEARPTPSYLEHIEAVGRLMVGLQAEGPEEDGDDLRRVIAILRSVYRRARARGGSVL